MIRLAFVLWGVFLASSLSVTASEASLSSYSYDEQTERGLYEPVEGVIPQRIYAYQDDAAAGVTFMLAVGADERDDFHADVLSLLWDRDEIAAFVEESRAGVRHVEGHEQLVSWLIVGQGSVVPGAYFGYEDERYDRMYRLGSVTKANGGLAARWIRDDLAERARINLGNFAEETNALFVWEQADDTGRWYLRPIPHVHRGIADKDDVTAVADVHQGLLYHVYRNYESEERGSWHVELARRAGSSALVADPAAWLLPGRRSVLPSTAFHGGDDRTELFQHVVSGNVSQWAPVNEQRPYILDIRTRAPYLLSGYDRDANPNPSPIWVKATFRKPPPVAAKKEFVFKSVRSEEMMPYQWCLCPRSRCCCDKDDD